LHIIRKHIFLIIKVLIHFILLGHIWKAKLLDCTLTTNGVSNIINLNKILKYDLGYKKFKEQIKTSLDYLDPQG
jgi:hypothetical protein